MMSGNKGSSHRGDRLVPSPGMNFGVDAYTAFRGMFETGGPMGSIGNMGNMAINAGLSGHSLQYSAPVRNGALGLPGIGADLMARIQHSNNQHGEQGDMSEVPSKVAEYDLENMPDILTNGGR